MGIPNTVFDREVMKKINESLINELDRFLKGTGNWIKMEEGDLPVWFLMVKVEDVEVKRVQVSFGVDVSIRDEYVENGVVLGFPGDPILEVVDRKPENVFFVRDPRRGVIVSLERVDKDLSKMPITEAWKAGVRFAIELVKNVYPGCEFEFKSESYGEPFYFGAGVLEHRESREALEKAMRIAVEDITSKNPSDSFTEVIRKNLGR